MNFAPAITATLLAFSTPASAQQMTAADFLGKAEALIRSGNGGSDSPQLRSLKEAAQAAAMAVRARQRSDGEAGRPARLCMPDKVSMDGTEFIAHLTGVPRERRNVPLVEAFADFMGVKYPCPARG